MFKIAWEVGGYGFNEPYAYCWLIRCQYLGKVFFITLHMNLRRKVYIIMIVCIWWVETLGRLGEVEFIFQLN